MLSSQTAKRWFPALLALVIGGWWLYVMFTSPPDGFINWLPGAAPSYDPDMAYLYNALLPFAGYNYQDVNLPGTALHMLGTGVAALFYPLARWAGVPLAAYHAGDPFPLLWTLRASLALLGYVVSLGLFRMMHPVTNWREMIQAAAVSLSFLAVYLYGWVTVVAWSHAALGYTVGGLILLGLYRVAAQPGPPHWWQAAGLGVAAGLLNAAAYYYAPFVLTVGLALWWVAWVRGRGGWQGLALGLGALAASVGGFLLGTVPIWGRLNRVIAGNLALHTRSPNLPRLDDLTGGALEVYSQHPTPYWVLGILLVLSLGVVISQVRRLREHAALWVLQGALVVHVVFGLLVVFSHPEGRYLNLVAPVVPFLLLVLFRVMAAQRLALVVALVVLVMFITQASNAFTVQYQVAGLAASKLNDVDTLVADYATQTGQREQDVLLVTGYGTHFNCYGMWYGSGAARYLLHEPVGASCPQMAEFDNGFDEARTQRGVWRRLDDDTFCWDMAVLERYDGSDLLSQFAAPFTTEHGYVIVQNDRIFLPRQTYRANFDTLPCGRGWGMPQVADGITYAWTTAPTATVELALQNATAYDVTVQLYDALSPDVADSLTLTINGEALPLAPVPGAPQRYRADLPGSVVALNEQATIFELSTTRVGPLDGTADTSPVGVAVDYIDIAPAG